MRPVSTCGFTLIELLIAVALMGVVMAVASMSFSIFSQGWGKQGNEFRATADISRQLYLFQQVVEGISNYPVKTEEDIVYFFRGGKKEVEFVSHKPIFERDRMAKIRIVVAEAPDSVRQQLVYMEAPFDDELYVHTGDEIEFKHRLVLLTAENIRFNYNGWESSAARVSYWEGGEERPVWMPTYFAEDVGLLPYGFNIIWGENEPIVFPLHHDNGYQLSYTHEKRSGG